MSRGGFAQSSNVDSNADKDHVSFKHAQYFYRQVVSRGCSGTEPTTTRLEENKEHRENVRERRPTVPAKERAVARVPLPGVQ